MKLVFVPGAACGRASWLCQTQDFAGSESVLRESLPRPGQRVGAAFVLAAEPVVIAAADLVPVFLQGRALDFELAVDIGLDAEATLQEPEKRPGAGLLRRGRFRRRRRLRFFGITVLRVISNGILPL